jgi:hypothetical protein
VSKYRLFSHGRRFEAGACLGSVIRRNSLPRCEDFFLLASWLGIKIQSSFGELSVRAGPEAAFGNVDGR